MVSKSQSVQSQSSFARSYAMDFDGSDEQVNCGFIDMSTWGALTVSAWFQADSPSAKQQRIVAKDQSGTPGAFILRQHQNELQVYFRDGSDDTWAGGGPSVVATQSDTNWHHGALVFDGSAVELYLDGNSQGSVSVTANTVDDSDSEDVAIGSDSDKSAPESVFDGRIDEVSIWNASLSASQITEIYNSGTPDDLGTHSAYADLIGWWRMGNSGLTNFNDTVSNEWHVHDQQRNYHAQSVNMESGDRKDGVTRTFPVRGMKSYLHGKTSSGDIVTPNLWISGKDDYDVPLSNNEDTSPTNLTSPGLSVSGSAGSSPEWQGGSNRWRFDSSNSEFWDGGSLLDETYSAYTVASVVEPTLDSNNDYIWSFWSDPSTPYITLEQADGSTPRVFRIFVKDDNGNGAVAGYQPSTFEKRHVVVIRFDSSQVDCWVDSASNQDTSTSVNTGITVDNLRIGCRDTGGGNSAFLNSYLHELITWPDLALTGSFIENTLIPDLTSKWNI